PGHGAGDRGTRPDADDRAAGRSLEAPPWFMPGSHRLRQGDPMRPPTPAVRGEPKSPRQSLRSLGIGGRVASRVGEDAPEVVRVELVPPRARPLAQRRLEAADRVPP